MKTQKEEKLPRFFARKRFLQGPATSLLPIAAGCWAEVAAVAEKSNEVLPRVGSCPSLSSERHLHFGRLEARQWVGCRADGEVLPHRLVRLPRPFPSAVALNRL